MSITLRPPAGALSAGLAASALLVSGLLSGCGVAGTSFNPGVAARVGDDTIRVDKVDELAQAYCAAIEPQLEGQVLPNSYLRGGIVGQLAVVSAAEQLAEEYGVEPGRQYQEKVAQLQSAAATLPEDQRDAVVEVEAGSDYLSAVLVEVGEERLREAGSGRPKIAEATAEGEKTLSAWLEEHDVSIDPQFGIEIEDGKPVQTDTGVSFAVGDAATSARAETPDQQYAGSLPASHRCG